MRIIIASDQHWPMISGVATAGRTLAHGLAAHGHDVLVIAPSQTGRKYEEADENYQIVRTRSLPFPGRENLRISVAFENEIKKIIATFGPDIVHVHTQFTVGLTALRMARRLGVPIVATNHTMPENIIRNVRILMPLARPISHIITEYGVLLYKGADHIIMPTQAAINLFSYDSLDDVPVSAVSNGIDLNQYQPGPVPKAFMTRYGLPTNQPIISYIGRLDAEKHLNVLVAALAQVMQSQSVHGLIVGTGNAEADLKNQVEKLGLTEHVTFTGRVSEADKYLLHRVGQVFAMPSPTELQSLTTLEAMASGQPVVAVNAGALYELCHDGENGFLCTQDDPDDMAQKLIKVISDPGLRQRLSVESLKVAATHDLDHVIKQFEAIYTDVLERHAQKPPRPRGLRRLRTL